VLKCEKLFLTYCTVDEGEKIHLLAQRPWKVVNYEEGYTIVFDHDSQLGLTMDATNAHAFAQRAHEVAALPPNARQHPILLFEPHTIPGTLARLRPFIGNIGTTPSPDLPDSHNAGDFGNFLVGAHHLYLACCWKRSIV